MCVIGSAMFNLEPLFLAAAAKEFSLDASQMGWLASSEIAGIALASLLASRWIPVTGYRKAALLGLSMTIIGNLLSLMANDLSSLLLIRFITGFSGDGIVYICGIMVLGLMKNPTRAFGLLVFVNMMITAIAMKFLPTLLKEAPWEAMLGYLITMAIIGLFFSQALPDSSKKSSTKSSYNIRKTIKWNPLILFMLLAILTFSINLGAIWSFSERLGSMAGLELEEVGSYLSTSLPFQALGAIIAAWLGTRHGRIPPLVLVVVGQILGLYCLSISSAGMDWAFFAGMSLWGFSWNLGIAYQLGLVSDLPGGQKILGYVPGIEALGASLGAFIPALFIVYDDYSAVLLTASISIIISALLFFRVAIYLQITKIKGKYEPS